MSFVAKQRQAWAEAGSAEMARLRTQVDHLRQRVTPARKGQPFNIFTLLGVETDEVRTHSRLLAYWLNPDGSHGQGVLFLGQFLRYCQKRYAGFEIRPKQLYNAQWRVQTERYIGQGFLDIVIESPQLGYLIVIENKIRAAEQLHQLERYARWMQTRVDQFPKQALIYLTPEGRAATTQGAFTCHEMSYHTDVNRWLSMVTPRIRSTHVKSIVHQYQAVLPRL